MAFFYIYICSFSNKLCYFYSRIYSQTFPKQFDFHCCFWCWPVYIYRRVYCVVIPNFTQTRLPLRNYHIDLDHKTYRHITGCLCKHSLHVSSRSLLLSRRILLPSVGKIQLHQSHRYSTSVTCAWFQAACIPLRSHGFWYSLMWLNLHFAAKQQATRCFRLLKLIQSGLFMLRSNIHLLGLPHDAQFGQTWHLSHNCSMERGLAVGLYGQLHHCNWPYYPAAWFRSPSSVMVSAEPVSDRFSHMLCNSSQMRPCQITDIQLWPAADYEPHHWCTVKIRI